MNYLFASAEAFFKEIRRGVTNHESSNKKALSDFSGRSDKCPVDIEWGAIDSGFENLECVKLQPIDRVLKYRIVSKWKVRGDKATVAEIFRDTSNIQNWWRATFLKTKVLSEGQNGEIGKIVRVHAKGWAPFSMRFWFLVREEIADQTFKLDFVGDFNGFAVCSLRQLGDFTYLTLDWNVAVGKPFLILGSFVLKPLFKLNHLWAMSQGQKSLQIELLRREEKSFEIPPSPTFPHNIDRGSPFYQRLFFDPLETKIPDAFLR